MTTAHRCGAWGSRDAARAREVTTAQLLPRHLRAGVLPAAAVGDVVHVTPVIHASGTDRLRGRPARLWDLDPYGTLVACGVLEVLSAGGSDLDVLVVGQRSLPLTGAGRPPSELGAGQPLYVEGSVHLDVELRRHAATDRAYRLVALRRYRLRPGGARPRTEHLDRVPGPEGVDADVFLHVADLVAEDQP